MSTTVKWTKSKPSCRITIWWTFGRIQSHVIPEPPATLQGAATCWIHCHDCRATCHNAGCSHLAKPISWSCQIAACNNSIRHIENRFSPYFILFLFFNAVFGFDERRLSYRLRYTCSKSYARKQKWVFFPTRCILAPRDIDVDHMRAWLLRSVNVHGLYM